MIEFLESRIAPAVVLNKGNFFTGSNPSLRDLIAVDPTVGTDHSGNIVVVGQYTSSIKLDFFTDVTPLSTADPAGDIYIAMYAPDHTLLWQNQWGGTGTEIPTSVTFDDSGNLFIGGSFASSSASLASGGASLNVTNGVPQGFVLKLSGFDGSAMTAFNGSGALKFGNGTDPSSINAVAVDKNGNLGFGGSFTGSNNVIGNASFGISATDTDGFYGRVSATTGAPDSLVGSTTGLVDLTFGNTFQDSVDKIIFGNAGNAILRMTSTSTAGGTPVTAVTAVQLKASDASLESAWGSGGIAPIDSNVSTNAVDFAFDTTENLIVARASGSVVTLTRYHSNDGSFDNTFGQNGVSFIFVPGGSAHIIQDAGGGFYLGGETTTTTHANYVAHFNSTGAVDTLFGNKGFVTFGGADPALGGASDLGMALDPTSGKLILKDSFVGNPDVDPSKSVLKLIPAGTPTGGTFLLTVDPNAIVGGQTFTIPGQTADGHQSFTIVTLTGPGYIHVSPNINAAGNVDLIELFNTTLASSLTVKVINPVEPVTVKQIVTHDAAQNVGSISLDNNTVLNDGEMTAAATLLVTGKINNIALGDVNGNTVIKLGQDLPYNVPTDTTTPDTYNNKPNLTVHDVIGDNLIIENIGDGTPGGIGGGGFGKIVFNNWSSGGVIRTTQGIGSFTILNGDFNATLEVDKFHVGESTTANVGSMTVQNGSWGSSGTEIEGNVGVFDVDAFLAGASITAGSVTKVVTGTGEFNGTLTLTDTQAKGVATFTVGTNFQGHVVSNSPLKKLVIKGDFMGSLSAPSIASITAFSFLGTTAGDMEGDANRLNITTTAGLLGLITAKSGIIKDFEFTSPVTFSGMKVVLSKLIGSTVGIENVNVAAHDIGPITVQLAANAKTAGVDLTGIENSSFSSDGKIGAVLVKLSGASGASLGLSNASFSGASLANVTVNVTKGSMAGATAQAVNTATLSSGGNIGVVSIIGDATMTQASELDIFATGKVTALNVKSKTAAFGTLDIGRVLVGEAFDPTSILDKKGLTKALAGSSIGAINISGSLTNTTLASGGNFAALNIGGDMTNSTVIAGAYLGDDRALGGTNDVYHRAASIASITVKGAFTQSTIAAGINPGDNVIGNGDDTAAGLVNNALVTTSAIKSISIGIATLGAGAPGMPHSYGIEAQTIGKLTIAGQKVELTDGPLFLDNSPTGEGAEDITVNLVIPV